MNKIFNIFVFTTLIAGASLSVQAAERVAATMSQDKDVESQNSTFKTAALAGEVETVRSLLATGTITGRSCFEAIEWNIGVVQAHKEKHLSVEDKTQYRKNRADIAAIIEQYMTENQTRQTEFLTARAEEDEDPTGALI